MILRKPKAQPAPVSQAHRKTTPSAPHVNPAASKYKKMADEVNSWIISRWLIACAKRSQPRIEHNVIIHSIKRTSGGRFALRKDAWFLSSGDFSLILNRDPSHPAKAIHEPGLQYR